MRFNKPCLKCKALHRNPSLCDNCQRLADATRNATRPHYKGSYAKQAKQVRDTATVCWLCGLGRNPDDPFTADHYYPGDPDSPLIAAHRSCNSRRGNTPYTS
jgi:hypothetical protein